MTKKRLKIPQKVAAKLLARNRHTCCICREPRKHVQIHHMDEDPGNYDLENLAVVCSDCHSRVTGNEGLGRRFSLKEIRIYKEEWEEKCSSDGDEEEPTDGEYEETEIEAGMHKTYAYYLEEGDLFTASVSSDVPLDVYLAKERDYERWANDKGHELHDLEGNEQVLVCELDCELRRKGSYVLVVVNRQKRKAARVEVDIAIWED